MALGATGDLLRLVVGQGMALSAANDSNSA
jgi:hypothetical protein